MDQKLNNILHPKSYLVKVFTINCSIIRIVLQFIFPFLPFGSFAQHESIQSSKQSDYNNDSSYINVHRLKGNVAKAQINALKNGGALLIRLKTNALAIHTLKAAGNMDLATQIERETYTNNKHMVRAYTKQFTFCPVYFFYSTYSDSIKHKSLHAVFLDTNLVIDPSIVCNAQFYLIAEQGGLCSSSLGLVPESKANNITEKGSEVKTVFAVVKNRYFIQLHAPFPYYQKGSGNKFKNYEEYVKKFNKRLTDFYIKNSGYDAPHEVKEFVY